MMIHNNKRKKYIKMQFLLYAIMLCNSLTQHGEV